MEGENEYKKGLWSPDEDRVLLDVVSAHGAGRWNLISKLTGLKRNARSCRTRWLNYLSPNVKRGDFSEEEDDLIIRLHKLLGNRWSLIAGRLPGRTDNQVKNYWNCHLSKKLGIKNQTGKVVVSSSETHSSLEVAGGKHKQRDMEVMKNDQEPLVAGGDHDSNEEKQLMTQHCADSLSCSDGNLVSWGMVEFLQGYPSSPVVASNDNFLF